MGEAKRREELGLPPRQKKVELNKSDRYLSWLPITKSRIKKYPYIKGYLLNKINSQVYNIIFNIGI